MAEDGYKVKVEEEDVFAKVSFREFQPGQVFDESALSRGLVLIIAPQVDGAEKPSGCEHVPPSYSFE
jgi:hypothetical protein